MTMNISTETLDCRGQRCPAPILALSKRARAMGEKGGLLEIRADDPAFTLDLESWCRSAKAVVVHLDDDGDGKRALIRVPSKRRPASPKPRPHVVPDPVSIELDCRGARCPEPILRVSRAARTAQPGTEIEILADDDAFPLDLRSWCQSSGSTLLELSTAVNGHQRARVRVAEAPRLQTHVQPHVQKVAPPPTRAPVPVVASADDASREIVVDLRALPSRVWDTVLDGAREQLGEGQLLRVLGAGPESSAHIVGWCARRGHELVNLQTAGLSTAEIRLRGSSAVAELEVEETSAAETTALANTKPGCTLLVLHNDHEALLAAMLVAVGAASQGKEVVVFFTFWGLNLLRGDSPNTAAPKQPVSLMQRMMKMMMPKGPDKQSLGQMNFGGAGKAMLGSIMRKQNIMSLPELMATAEEQGVRFIACTMSMEVMGITKRDLQPRPNLEYGGVAAFVDNAHGAGMSLVF